METMRSPVETYSLGGLEHKDCRRLQLGRGAPLVIGGVRYSVP
jgi:hypothetical protein